VGTSDTAQRLRVTNRVNERFGDLHQPKMHCRQIAAPRLVAAVDWEKLFGEGEDFFEVNQIDPCR